MNLTATTITVYFVGLVNVYHPQIPPSTIREVIVPLASSGIYGTLTLQAHQAHVEIEGLDGMTPDKDCREKLGGQWSDEKDTCTVKPVSGKKIRLPASKDPLDVMPRYNKMPGMTTLCPRMGDIKDMYLNESGSYAARLTLDTGTLDVCSKGDAWVSVLTLTDPTGTFSLGGEGVTLKDKAVVQIVNLATATGTGDQSHFSWHYKMYNTPMQCDGLPDPPPSEVDACPATVAHFHEVIQTASSAGCSNTQYP